MTEEKKDFLAEDVTIPTIGTSREVPVFKALDTSKKWAHLTGSQNLPVTGLRSNAKPYKY